MKHFEFDGNALCLTLYTDVTNSKQGTTGFHAGWNTRTEVAFLNASLIPDVFPVLAAAHKTLLAKAMESLTTRTLHSELVYNYSGSKHWTKAIEKLITGKEIELEELANRANQAQHYKITILELRISSLADAITCRIAARDAL